MKLRTLALALAALGSSGWLNDAEYSPNVGQRHPVRPLDSETGP